MSACEHGLPFGGTGCEVCDAPAHEWCGWCERVVETFYDPAWQMVRCGEGHCVRDMELYRSSVERSETAPETNSAAPQEAPRDGRK